MPLPDNFPREIQHAETLIDSAGNNHTRFVRAALQSEYRGPSYDGDAWVRLHRYESLPWSTLLAWWSTLNHIIVQVVLPHDDLGGTD